MQELPDCRASHILVSQVLEQLKFAIGTLGQDGSAERLHDLLDGAVQLSEAVLTYGSECVSRGGTCE